MKRAEAIKRIQAAAKARALVFTPHARQAMLDDGETTESVSSAILRATLFRQQDDGTWRVRGDEITIVVALREAVTIVTVFI